MGGEGRVEVGGEGRVEVEGEGRVEVEGEGRVEVGRAGGEVRWDGEVRVHYIRTYVPVRACFVSNTYLFQNHKRQVKERDGLVVSLSKQLSLKGITSTA